MTGFILNSRPIEHRARFHAAFGEVLPGWRIIDCPVLTAESLTAPLPDAGAFDVVIFTSQIAASLFRVTADWSGKTVLAVGEATASAARAVGFTNVVDTGKDVDDLHAILSRADFDRALYPSAEDVTADLSLEFAGRISRLVTYRMAPRKSLGLDDLAPGWDMADVIAPLFSKRSAAALSDLLAKALAEGSGTNRARAANIAAVGISADVLVDGPWKVTAVADEPTLTAVAAAAARLAGTIPKR